MSPRPPHPPAGRTGSSRCGGAPAGRRPALPHSRRRCGGAPGCPDCCRPQRAEGPRHRQTPQKLPHPPAHSPGWAPPQARPLPDRTPAHIQWYSSCRRGCARTGHRSGCHPRGQSSHRCAHALPRSRSAFSLPDSSRRCAGGAQKCTPAPALPNRRQCRPRSAPHHNLHQGMRCRPALWRSSPPVRPPHSRTPAPSRSTRRCAGARSRRTGSLPSGQCPHCAAAS